MIDSDHAGRFVNSLWTESDKQVGRWTIGLRHITGRERIDHGRESRRLRERCGAKGRPRREPLKRLVQALPVAFESQKEERFIVTNRPAEVCAKLIQVKAGISQSKRIASIKNIVA